MRDRDKDSVTSMQRSAVQTCEDRKQQFSTDSKAGTKLSHNRSWQVLSRGPSGDRIARSCRHTGPDLTIRIGVKDRIAELLSWQYVWASGALSNHDCMP